MVESKPFLRNIWNEKKKNQYKEYIMNVHFITLMHMLDYTYI